MENLPSAVVISGVFVVVISGAESRKTRNMN